MAGKLVRSFVSKFFLKLRVWGMAAVFFFFYFDFISDSLDLCSALFFKCYDTNFGYRLLLFLFLFSFYRQHHLGFVRY